MQIVIKSSGRGCFFVPEEAQKVFNGDPFDQTIRTRTDPRFIQWVNNHRDHDLRVVTIPENATDWEIHEHESWGYVIAVVDGKLVHIR